MLNKIIVTGGDGRFAQRLKKIKSKYQFIFRNKKQFNILSLNSIKKNLKKFKPDCVLHLAGLSRPMSIHEKKINQSIDLNIIGTSNLVKVCNQKKIKIIFLSTSYVYQGKKGNYKEEDTLLPWNNYGWSKLGAESSVHMYKNSLILRICMTDYPFIHKKAIKGAFTSFTFNKNVAELIPHILNQKGILNVGGKKREIYKFAKKFSNNKITSINYKKILNFPKDSSLNLNKLKNIIKRKKLKKLNVII